MAVLGVFLSLGVFTAIPKPVAAGQGVQVLGVWIAAQVDFYASPADGGTVTRPDGFPTNPWNFAATVPGGNGYGTCAATGSACALAPMDFWATAVPNAGWKFLGWSNGHGDWYSGNRCHVQYVEARLDMLNGWEQIVAMFTEETVTVDFRAGTGIIYDVNSGSRELEPNGVVPMECHVSPAYEGLYEFGGWIGDFDTIQRVNDPTVPNTYLDMDLYEWISGGPYWIQPTIRTKVTDEYLMEFTTDGPGCFISQDNVTVRVGEKGEFSAFTSDVEERYTLLRWDLTNVGCSDIYDEAPFFWLLTAGSGHADAVTTDSEVTPEIVTVTMAKTGQGSTVPSVGSHNQLAGRLFDIKATPASGYRFSQWNNLPNGLLSANPYERIAISENTTITAIFVLSDTGGGTGDGSGDSGGAAVASGIWGRITNSLSSVGLGNPMGHMMVVLAGMVVAAVMCGNNSTMRVVAPLGVLGIGIIGFWVPSWIVVLLAIAAGFAIMKIVTKSAGAGE